MLINIKMNANDKILAVWKMSIFDLKMKVDAGEIN